MQTFIFTVKMVQGFQVCKVQRGRIVQTSSLGLLPIGTQLALKYTLHQTQHQEDWSLGELRLRLEQDEEAIFPKRLLDRGTLLLVGDGLGGDAVVSDVNLRVDEAVQSGVTLPPPDPDLSSAPVRSEPFPLSRSAPPPAPDSVESAPQTSREVPSISPRLAGPRITAVTRDRTLQLAEVQEEADFVRQPGAFPPAPLPGAFSGKRLIPDEPRSSPPPVTVPQIPSRLRRRSGEMEKTVPSPPPFSSAGPASIGPDSPPVSTPRETPVAKDPPAVSGVPLPDGYVPRSQRKGT